ncbi:hypothetical protein HY772_02545 [Candidatus Woesearchaeota archaeon]|nr:hypothetical protein [Candidatus Woesearchaeota archaeon]
MSEAETVKGIYEELRSLREEVRFIKKHMVDADTILTHEDKTALQEAREDIKKGKTVRLDKLREELGI